jgi:hypothetical protein
MMQEILRMKKLIVGTTLALATLTAAPAFAKTHHMAAPGSDGSYASAAGPNTVIVEGQVVGADPDPNIRFQLERDPVPTGD